MAKPLARTRARELRAQGRSYNEIAAELGISKSTCSLWLRDMPRPIDRTEHVRRIQAARRPGDERRRAATTARRLDTKLTAAREIGPLSTRDLLLAGAIAYWCEGAKNKPHQRVDRIDFINSDPALIAFFLRFLKAAGARREQIRLQVQIHETADLLAAERFWGELTGEGPDRFNVPGIKPANPVTKRRNIEEGYRGCLRITLRESAELYHRIHGWSHAAMAYGALTAGRRPETLGLVPALPYGESRVRALELRRAGMDRRAIQHALRIPDMVRLGQLLKGEPPASAWLERATARERVEEQAHELRAQGWGHRRIAEHLDVPRSEIRLLLEDRPGAREEEAASGDARAAGIRAYWKERSRQLALEREQISAAAAAEIGDLGRRELLMLGALAYWCEGAKDKPYQRREGVAFVNSDPGLVALFAGFLGAAGIDRARWKPRVLIHESGDLAQAVAFWAGVLGVAEADFRKATIKRHRPRTDHSERSDYRGCLRLDVAKGTDLYRRIEGWALGTLLGETGARSRWTEEATPTGDLR
ncbi:hypothetical protein [Actinomadura parmotrematis]|uniref:Helix-turn-helix domain-containing protein n=1 Tax=Actinomadura parmotrematis TaxID=2864039 RepID=A0ABS7FML2_9ACTN|nr:hypothetical protein [Actinomadura parmotrematis]MBW8481627.1 hypothetical protein [Actinomadura parmotrematis]